MEPDYHAQLKIARLLFDNHWLSHARQKCLSALPAGAQTNDEAGTLLRTIEDRLRDRSALNLSLDHAPITILMDQECIISTLHFRHLESDLLKREAFRQGVYYIDIETSSQCNRKCHYCPNSQNDRFSHNKFMDDAVFTSCMENLAAIGYSKDIHFVGFNEPLLYMANILDRIELASKLVPKSRIVIYTNGDYLEREDLNQLIRVGSNAERLGTPIQPLRYEQNRQISARLVHNHIRILIYQLDYEQLGSNRAATLENIGPNIGTRTAACLMPIYQFIVGHQGAVVPCCVMVSDDERNAKYLMGNVGQAPSIFDIYCGADFVAWRRSLFNLAPKPAPCQTCNTGASLPLLNAPETYDPWQHLVSPPILDPVVL